MATQSKLAQAQASAQAQANAIRNGSGVSRKATRQAQAQQQNPAQEPSYAILSDLHAQAQAQDETWLVLGTDALRTGAVRLPLDLCFKRGQDGRLSNPEMAAVEPCTGSGRLSRNGEAVSHGRIVTAPTGEKDGVATACLHAWFVGADIVPNTVAQTFPSVDLSTDGRGNRYATGRYATVTTADGAIWSADVQVVPTAAGDAWNVTRARLYSGGRLADPDAQIRSMYGIVPIDAAAATADKRKASARKAAATRRANRAAAQAKAETDALPGVPAPVLVGPVQIGTKAERVRSAAE